MNIAYFSALVKLPIQQNAAKACNECINNPIAQLNLYGWAFIDYNKVIKNRPLKMENKQVQIHIEKIKLLYQNSLITILLSGVAGLFFGGRIVEQRNSPTSAYLASGNDFIRLHSRHAHHQISTRKASVARSAKVGGAIRHKPASGIFMLERWFNLDYAAR